MTDYDDFEIAGLRVGAFLRCRRCGNNAYVVTDWSGYAQTLGEMVTEADSHQCGDPTSSPCCSVGMPNMRSRND
ncbi:hypothetical protein GCM10012275_28580 [Longimycelium tulufanense]|uniref:Uncharacterized protein n=1 Tax=Longimycelium tulufanense TaxID=907463 RepID=A0A8J3FV70_9PSEU|nr:hypothetical protein [Longimycelium tulufanense]GGM55749.1 hypothetical protein GCM10012275_28580 [Longimycelium tulufanense]